jgi:vitamin B12 transporter
MFFCEKRTFINIKTARRASNTKSSFARFEVLTMFSRSFYKTIAAFIAITSSNAALADENSNEKSNNEEIVITVNRTKQNINDALAAVDIITREDIERVQPESITDLLATVAGFDLVYNGGAGQNSSLFTRGTSSDHTLILVDGIRVGSATLGNKIFATIPVAQIERIEIVKGPRASLWGSDAIGGVIHIFTRRLNAGEYSLSMKLGSKSFKSTDLSIGFGRENFNNTATLSFEQSDGFDVFDNASEFGPDSEPDDDGYQRISAAIRGDLELSQATNLDWVFQYDQGDNSFDNSWGANETQYNNFLWNVRYLYQIDNWLTEFSVKQSRDKSFSYDSREAEKIGSVFETRRNQFNLLTQYTYSENINVSAGIERYDDDVSKSKVRQFDGSFADFANTQRASQAAYVSSIMKFGRFLTEVSARYDDIEFAGFEKTFNLSAGYKISDNITAAISRSKGYKAPTFNDLYYPGFGNPSLKSEISLNTELLIRGEWDNHTFALAKYNNDVDQLISYNPATFSSENIAIANLNGYEISYLFRQGALSHQFTASFVDAIDKSIDSVTGSAINEQLPRRAKEHYGYELIAELGDFSFFTQLNFIGGRNDKSFLTFPAKDVSLKGYAAVNLGASYQVSEQLSFKLKVSDFTDAAERTIANYNAPGQQVFVSVLYNNF